MVKSLFSLTGRVALVTGAGQGLGRAYAGALADAGAAVVCLDRDPAAAGETRDIIIQKKALAEAVQCDITDLAGIRDRLYTDCYIHKRFLSPGNYFLSSAPAIITCMM
jgi:NADP-dependent 3-hydroxy acid dehydrogenase YdfG